MDDDGLLAEQRAYYQARAPEYDEWWQRRDRFDQGPESAEEWDRDVAQMAAALETFGATGDVLELAGGTGWWTAHLARTAGHLTVIDSSPESLELNRKRVGRPDVDYLVADLFTWQPLRTYDVVFFSFWLSHVPRPRFPGFWSLCGPVLHREVGCSSSTTASRSRAPTSSGVIRIWSSAACTTEGSSRSSRSSTSRRSCSHFLVMKAGRQASMEHAGSSSEKRPLLTPGSPPGQKRHRRPLRPIIAAASLPQRLSWRNTGPSRPNQMRRPSARPLGRTARTSSSTATPASRRATWRRCS